MGVPVYSLSPAPHGQLFLGLCPSGPVSAVKGPLAILLYRTPPFVSLFRHGP